MSQRVRRPRPGSNEHRDLFCRSFVETHVRFDASGIEWPELDQDALERLRALPFWGEAVSTEATTARWIAAVAAREEDPVVREALRLQAVEESRHAQVIRGLVTRYGIDVGSPEEEPVPSSLEWAFLRTGYGECFDSFFAFGLFKLAEGSGFFPAPLVRVFDPLLQEEARHVIFFVNWVSWKAARLGLAARTRHRALCLGAIAHQLWGRVQTARGVDTPHFTASRPDALGASVSLGSLLDWCVEENDRRQGQYDPRLLRPRVIPALARAARWALAPKVHVPRERVRSPRPRVLN